jgi:ectoine hydroxylase-related dioxygenase (phytanoyl-CoA dioxygenase family)
MMLAACRKTLRRPVAPIATGDVLIFDYRVLHRGLANKTMQTEAF